jgi:hypothetical protein
MVDQCALAIAALRFSSQIRGLFIACRRLGLLRQRKLVSALACARDAPF